MQRREFVWGSLAAALSGIASHGVARQPATVGEAVDMERYREAATTRWESAIAELERLDRAESHPDDSILFVGSSSIRLWDDIAIDMAPYHPIRRGYGGARWSDLAVFADRLICPHRFRAVVFFVANDITGSDDDETPDQVARLFDYVLGRARLHAADASAFCIAVTPTERRFDAWPRIKAANAAVQAVCARSANTHFIGTESVFLNAGRQPRPELFRDDRLHLSRAGYVLWAAAIKSQLDTVLGGAG